MKIILFAFLLTSMNLNAQWVIKNVKNGFDDPYKICYNESRKGTILKMEDIGKSENDTSGFKTPSLYITNFYFCTKKPEIAILLIVNGEQKKYECFGLLSADNKTCFINFFFYTNDYWTNQFYKDFKNASKIKIRINDLICGESIHEFNMIGSSKAVDFLQN